jgi:hypothetical protein
MLYFTIIILSFCSDPHTLMRWLSHWLRCSFHCILNWLFLWKFAWNAQRWSWSWFSNEGPFTKRLFCIQSKVKIHVQRSHHHFQLHFFFMILQPRSQWRILMRGKIYRRIWHLFFLDHHFHILLHRTFLRRRNSSVIYWNTRKTVSWFKSAWWMLIILVLFL